MSAYTTLGIALVIAIAVTVKSESHSQNDPTPDHNLQILNEDLRDIRSSLHSEVGKLKSELYKMKSEMKQLKTKEKEAQTAIQKLEKGTLKLEHSVENMKTVTFERVGVKKRCNKRSLYTFAGRSYCDGWGSSSLYECITRCRYNDIPTSNCPRHPKCAYVEYDHRHNWCHLADSSCKMEATGSDISIWKKSDI